MSPLETPPPAIVGSTAGRLEKDSAMNSAMMRATVDFLRAAPAAVLLTHERPDGDAIGSVVGLAHYFHATKRPCEIWLYDPPPERYAHLLQGVVYKVLDRAVAAAEPASGDALAVAVARGSQPDPQRLWIIADTCAYAQLGPIATALRERGGADWVFDHHLGRDVTTRIPGLDGSAAGLIDTSASATGLLVFETLTALGLPLWPQAAEALFTAICTDTGWFRFPSADLRTYRAVTALVEVGVKPAEVYERLFQNDAPSRTALVAEALAGLELHADGQVAIMALSQEHFRRSRSSPSETENLTDEASRIRGVNVVMLLVEMGDGRVRCSFRSKRHVDVNALAGLFGGGGHARASGARLTGSLEAVKSQLLEAVGAALARPPAPTML